MSAGGSAADSCRGEPGKVPVVDRNRCEAKADWVRVCPYDVFEIRKLAPEERASLSWLGKLKALGHGGKQAFVVRARRATHASSASACPETR